MADAQKLDTRKLAPEKIQNLIELVEEIEGGNDMRMAKLGGSYPLVI